MTKKQIFILLLILAVAAFFRFYLIKEFPGGLFPDEAANGLDVNLMQQGHLQPFYERGNGREALFFYMLWGSVALFGKGPWQHHIVSAAVGLLGVLLCFLAARKLFLTFGPSEDSPGISWRNRSTYIGLLSAFLMAVSTWHITLSRTAFRANLIPLFAAGTIYSLLCVYTSETKRKRIIWGIVTGAVFALGFYTYIAYRIMVPILGVAVLWPVLLDWFGRPRFLWTRRFWLPTAAFLAAALIFIFPLAHYFFTHPGSFIGRSSQVSVFNHDLNQGHLLGTIGEVTKQSLLGYFYEGDLNWRHNVSGQPFLPIMVSPFFALGLILCTLLAVRYAFSPRRHSSDWKYFLLAGWFWGMLIPVITTAEGIPHGLRSIGTIPPVFILGGWGLYLVWESCHKIAMAYWAWLGSFRQRLLTFAITLMKVCFVLALIIHAYILCFMIAWWSPEQAYAFRADLTTVSNYLNGFDKDQYAIPAGKIPNDFVNRHTKQNTYLVLDTYWLQTTDYLTTFDGAHPDNPKNQPYTKVNPEDAWKLNNLHSGDEIIFTQSTMFDARKFKQYHPEAALAREYRDRFGAAILAVYKVK